MVKDITANELRNMLKNNRENVEIIDVREPQEYEIIHIKGSKLIPMNELPSKLDQIDWTKEVVFVCRTGSRSKIMAYMLGINKEIKNLKYGIYECFADNKSEFLEINKDLIEGYF